MNPRVRLLLVIALAIGAIQLVWLVVPAIQEGLDEFPAGFVLVFCLPYFVGAALLPRFRRTGAVIIGLFSLLLIIPAAATLFGGPGDDWKWTDYLSNYVGGVLAVVAVVLSVMVLLDRRTSEAPGVAEA